MSDKTLSWLGNFTLHVKPDEDEEGRKIWRYAVILPDCSCTSGIVPDIDRAYGRLTEAMMKWMTSH